MDADAAIGVALLPCLSHCHATAVLLKDPWQGLRVLASFVLRPAPTHVTRAALAGP